VSNRLRFDSVSQEQRREDRPRNHLAEGRTRMTMRKIEPATLQPRSESAERPGGSGSTYPASEDFQAKPIVAKGGNSGRLHMCGEKLHNRVLHCFPNKLN
jgi:hypothetical protein